MSKCLPSSAKLQMPEAHFIKVIGEGFIKVPGRIPLSLAKRLPTSAKCLGGIAKRQPRLSCRLSQHLGILLSQLRRFLTRIRIQIHTSCLSNSNRLRMSSVMTS